MTQPQPQYPLYKITSWPADDPSGAGTTRLVLGAQCGQSIFELISSLTFRYPKSYNVLPDDWADFSTEWLQRGTYIECHVTDDGSFAWRFTISVNSITVAPTAGATYTNNGSTFSVISTDLTGVAPNIAGTLKVARTIGTADPELAGNLTKTAGVGDAVIAFTYWRPHTRSIFYGNIWKVGASRVAGREAELEVLCFDPLVNCRANGLNLSRQTRMLIWETHWHWNGAEWNVADPNFLVDVPDNLEEWVPKGVVHLERHRTVADTGDEIDTYEYDPSEYTYSASKKQIYFLSTQSYWRDNLAHTSPEPEIEAGGDWIWTVRLYYYDPLDVSNTVKEVLTDILTGTPYGHQGGCGFAAGDLDLAEVVGFNPGAATQDQWGYQYLAGTAKRVRSLLREKIDGPITQFFDDMRDKGLLPRNYWIRFDPQSRKVIGRYMLQDSAAVYTPDGTSANEQPITMEGIAGRCECWSKSGALQDFAKDASITLTVPTVSNVGGSFDGDPYTQVGTTSHLTDGDPDTFLQCSIEINTLDFDPQRTDDNYLVFDLGQEEEIRRIQLTGAAPEHPLGNERPIYFVSRQARVTISASCDPINAANPGIPVNHPGSISQQMDPLNIGANGGLDIDVECTNIFRARYVAIRFEQDNFVRVDGNNIGSTKRLSYFTLSCVKILGDGRLRYQDGTYVGQIPFAQLSGARGTITAHSHMPPDPAPTVTVSLADAALFTAGDLVHFFDVSGSVRFDDLYEIANVNPATGVITLTNALDLPAALANGDYIGTAKTWQQDTTGAWLDFFYPLLLRKVQNTSDWLEILTDDSPGDTDECDQLAADRLWELIHVARDHTLTTPLDLMLMPGATVRCSATEVDWLGGEAKWDMSPSNSPTTPHVMVQLLGTDYEEVPG